MYTQNLLTGGKYHEKLKKKKFRHFCHCRHFEHTVKQSSAFAKVIILDKTLQLQAEQMRIEST